MPSDKYQDLLEQKGGRGFPYLIWMDYEGNKIADVGGRDVAAFERSAAGLPAPKFDPVLAEKLTSNLAAAKSAIESKNYGRAVEAIKVVLSVPGEHAEKTEASGLLAEIEAAGQAALDEAKAKQGADPAAGHDALEAVAREFAGTTAGEEAKKALATLEADPAYQALVDERKADAAAAKLLEEARTALDAKKYLDAHRALSRILSDFASTSSCDEARRLLVGMEADEEIMRAVKEQEAEENAKRAMTMAKNYVANGNKDKAIKTLEEFAAKYAGTSWAEKARDMIGKIQRGELK